MWKGQKLYKRHADSTMSTTWPPITTVYESWNKNGYPFEAAFILDLVKLQREENKLER
jgi:hypothetical protein